MITTIQNPISFLEKEEEILRIEIREFEEIISDEIINYPNLVKVLAKIYEMWDRYESKRQKIFKILKSEGYSLDIRDMSFYGPVLSEDKEAFRYSLKSASEYNVKECLVHNGSHIVQTIKSVLEEVEWSLCSVNWDSIRKNSLDLIRIVQIIPIFNIQKEVLLNNHGQR